MEKPLEKDRESEWFYGSDSIDVFLRFSDFEMIVFYKVVPHADMSVVLVSLEITVRLFMVLCAGNE